MAEFFPALEPEEPIDWNNNPRGIEKPRQYKRARFELWSGETLAMVTDGLGETIYMHPALAAPASKKKEDA